jgi:glucose-1-phosphate cytidylyltransferase
LKLGRKPEITYHTEHAEEDWCVTLLDTGQETQTGGRLKRALPYIKDDTFLFTYGDGVIDSNINASIDFHKRNGGIATVTAVKPSGRFGELAMDRETIVGFHEKPEKEAGFISGGFFVMDRRIGDYIEGDRTVLELKPLEQLVQERKLKAYCHDGFWQCMDTFREQELLNKMWQADKAPWKIW